MKKIFIVTVLVETSPQALPLGAACIASALKADSDIAKECSVSLLDFSLEDSSLKNSAKKISENLIAQKPDIIGFSVFIWNRNVLAETAQLVKKTLPDVVLFCGGAEVTANPESFKNIFDYVIPGEGEQQCVKLIRKLCNLKPEKFSEEKTLQRTDNFSDCPTVLSSPYLDGTLDPEKYSGALWELARGCPFKCSYCFESKGEKRVFHFPEERLKQELDLFRKKKINQIWVLDPTYNADKKRAAAILDYIRKTAPEIFFHFEVRAEFLDNEMIKKFSAINCSLQIGIQSIHEDVLKNVNRSFNKKDFTKKISMLNSTGIIFGFDLIFGLPGDTYKKFCESLDFALSLYPNHLELFKLSILPGTALYDDCTPNENYPAKFNINFMNTPPYHIISSDTYTTQDIEKASSLSCACGFFYTQGRAVSWFLSILHPLKMKSSKFFYLFILWLNEKNQNAEALYKKCLPHIEIEKTQIEFIKDLYRQNGLKNLEKLIVDIIRLNGAFTRSYADGSTETLNLNYHPEELFSPYAQDIKQFFLFAKMHPCRINVFPSKNGCDYEFIR